MNDTKLIHHKNKRSYLTEIQWRGINGSYIKMLFHHEEQIFNQKTVLPLGYNAYLMNVRFIEDLYAKYKSFKVNNKKKYLIVLNTDSLIIWNYSTKIQQFMKLCRSSIEKNSFMDYNR